MQSDIIKKVKIVYYSGTGNTKKVVDCFEEVLRRKEIEVLSYSVSDKNIPQDKSEDLLLVIYAVHAMNAPEAVYQWMKKLSADGKGRAAVISVSGGGEIIPNTACRVSTIKKLKKKGYKVSYERMLVMPSNWIIETKEPLAVRLLEVLPERVEWIIEDLLSGVSRKAKPTVIDRIFAKLGELEKMGARSFGKRIRCQDTCIGCGWCSSHCPSDNIKIVDGRAVFGKRCHMCLNCIYGCPEKALSPGIANFIVIRQGYSLKELEQKVPYTESIDVEKLAAGYVWAGVKKYLLEDK